MILVDTNIWINHLHSSNNELRSILEEGRVIVHQFIQGELACGKLINRLEIIELLSLLPQCEVLEHKEVLEFISSEKLFNKGLGWIDVHLLGACRLSGLKLWTMDKALIREAKRMDLSY